MKAATTGLSKCRLTLLRQLTLVRPLLSTVLSLLRLLFVYALVAVSPSLATEVPCPTFENDNYPCGRDPASGASTEIPISSTELPSCGGRLVTAITPKINSIGEGHTLHRSGFCEFQVLYDLSSEGDASIIHVSSTNSCKRLVESVKEAFGKYVFSPGDEAWFCSHSIRMEMPEDT